VLGRLADIGPALGALIPAVMCLTFTHDSIIIDQ